MTLEELKVIISAETKGLREELKKAKAEIKSTSTTVSQQTSKMKSSLAGLKGAVAIAAISAALYKLGKESINVASNLTEVQNVVDVAFGEMAWKAERFAKNSIESFGMSELSAKKTSSTYMSMARSAGLSADKASDMAINLAGFSGDVASFFNISQELADVRLKSIFTGETETLKELGVVMTQTNLEAFALSRGIKTNIKDMNQAQQTTLRYNFVLDRLSMAQGDFARTSDSWANQVRTLKERFKQLLGIIGNGFITALTPVLQVINAVLAKLISFATIASGVFGRLFGKKNDEKNNPLSSVGDSAKKAVSSTDKYTGALKGTEGQAKKTAKAIQNLMGFDDLNILSSGTSEKDTGADAGTSGGYVIEPIDWGDTFKEPDTSGIKKGIDKVMKYVDQFKGFIEKYKVPILTVFSGIAAGIATFFGAKWLIGIGGLTGIFVKFLDIPGMQKLATGFIGVFKGIPVFFSGLFGKIASVIGSSKIGVMLSGVFSPIGAVIKGAFASIGGVLSSALTTISGFIGSMVSAFLKLPVIGPMFQSIFGAISGALSTAAGWFSTTFGWAAKLFGIIAGSPALLAAVVAAIVGAVVQLWMTSEEFRNNIMLALENIKQVFMALWENVLKPIFEAVIAICINVWENGLKPLWDVWVDLVGVVITIMANLWNAVAPILTELLNVLGPVFKGVLAGLSVIVSTIFNTILNVITICMGAASGVLEGFFSSIDQVFSGIKKIFSGVIDFITGIFTGNWKKAWNGVKSIFSGIFQTFGGIAKAPINAVIGIINGAINGINKIGFDVPDWVPFIGGKPFHIDIPKIPYLAQGTIADRPTLGIFGEAGTEAVIPLKRNTQGLDLIASKLAERLPSGNGEAGGTYVINLVLQSGERLAQMVIRNIKDYEIKTGKPAF